MNNLREVIEYHLLVYFDYFDFDSWICLFHLKRILHFSDTRKIGFRKIKTEQQV